MKIAILIPTIKPGGAEKQAALLAATLSQEHDVHFISLWGKKNLSMTVKKFWRMLMFIFIISQENGLASGGNTTNC